MVWSGSTSPGHIAQELVSVAVTSLLLVLVVEMATSDARTLASMLSKSSPDCAVAASAFSRAPFVVFFGILSE
jgi:hypothetical protein